MAKFKNPLAEHPWNLLSQRLKGAAHVDVAVLVDHVMEEIPRLVEEGDGFKVSAAKEIITIGGLFSSNDQPGIVFSFPGNPKYASVLVGFNKVGAVLDIEAIQYGGVSSNMQHANMSKMDQGIIKGLYHRAMTDTSAVEEEQMHYQAVIDSLADLIESWTE